MKLYVIRHGETDVNRMHLLQGQTDIPLCETGRMQARACALFCREQGIRFDYVYCSPLSRAVETCEIITGEKKEQFTIDARLAEINFGAANMTKFDSAEAKPGSMFDPEHYVVPAGGESFYEVMARTRSFLDTFADDEAKASASILVGSHGGAIRCMLAAIGFVPLSDIWHQSIGNCSIVELGLQEDHTWKVLNIHKTDDPFQN